MGLGISFFFFFFVRGEREGGLISTWKSGFFGWQDFSAAGKLVGVCESF